MDARLGRFAAMARIRAFEERVSNAHEAGQLPGLLHLSIGGEAVAVGVIGQLEERDRVYSSHRGHGHFLAAGEDAGAVLAELAGRETGLCRGRGGSMHLMGERAVLATGVVGGTLPIAVGHAVGLDEGAVVVVFFGDGAVQTGVFHESLNLAALWGARVLFVCENNGWAEFTSREEHTRVRDVVQYATLHDMPSEIVDGSDVGAVADAADRLLEHVRGDGGPALLECQVTRIRPHYEGDLRASGGVKEDRDPVLAERRRLVDGGVAERAMDDIVRGAREEAEALLAAALDAPLPKPEDDPGLVFARPR